MLCNARAHINRNPLASPSAECTVPHSNIPSRGPLPCSEDQENYLRRARLLSLFVAALLCTLTACRRASGQQLQIAYGTKGIQTLSFGGTTLEDVGAFPNDSFHIYHMKCESLTGTALSDGQYGWGENNNGTFWNAATHAETYTFSWGSIAVQFVQQGNTLNLLVTETNLSSSGVKFDGAEIFPLLLHFPNDPKGFNGYSQFLNTTTGPAVSVADFGSGVVSAVVVDESVAMHGGWKNAGGAVYSPVMSTTSPDGLATFLPHTDLPVAPGSTFHYTVSLRFAAAGQTPDATDAYNSFAATYPSQMTWSDHRLLGTAYLASSPANQGDKTKAGGFPTNPRRYFNDPTIDVTTSAGLMAFQKRMLAQAASNVANARAMSGQGVVTWDLEGEQYPQDTSYVCSPEQIAAVAPEMESVVADRTSPYFGSKLDDAYFKTMTSAGLRVGVCVRPQQFVLAQDGSASQNFLTGNDAIIRNLEKKIAFANSRWGATVFYIDSTVDSIGGTLDPAIFQKILSDFPSLLLIPEESTPRYYAYSAPFYSFLFHGTTGTDTSVYQYYPKAFGANLVNDVSMSALQSATPALTAAVAKGDILMGHADYWQANDPLLVAIYQAAAPAAPVRVTPSVSWATPSAIVYGTPLTSTQLNASASTAGTFTYNPALGTVLEGGANTLVTTFVPTDTTDYNSVTASTSLTVTPAAPVLTWPTPAAITYGKALGTTELNATSSAPGTLAFFPAAGTVVAAGQTTLTAVFTPTNAADYSAAQANVVLTVNQATPTLNWVTPSAIPAGTALSAAQLNATANVAGTFRYTPAAGTVLPVGSTTLSALFVPSDATNYKSATGAVALMVSAVAKVTPQITWSTPASIVYGTPLSAQQLNATASVPGTFQYQPAVNTVLPAGTQTLQTTFAPTDGTKYQSASASVQLSIAKAAPVLTWATPAAIAVGTALTTTQLNASASVAGTFQYDPAVGTVLAAGTQTLRTTFQPSDASNYLSQTKSVTIQVNAAAAAQGPLYILSPTSGTKVSGVITVSGVCRLPLDPAGSYLMADGVPVGTRRVVDGPYVYPLDTTTLTNGTHVLQLWAHDIGNNVTISPAITITVAN